MIGMVGMSVATPTMHAAVVAAAPAPDALAAAIQAQVAAATPPAERAEPCGPPIVRLDELLGDRALEPPANVEVRIPGSGAVDNAGRRSWHVEPVD